MDTKKFYRVFFETKHGRRGFLTSYFVDVLANNMNEAKSLIMDRWYANNNKHAFHVKCFRLNDCVLAESIIAVKSEPDSVKWFESRGINVF